MKVHNIMTNIQKVIRITRHPAADGRAEALKKAFGQNTIIIDDDVPYGDDPVKTVFNLIEKHGGNVVAIEVVAPVPVLARLTQAKRELGPLKILRAEFIRDDGGRAKVIGLDSHGREIFGFSHYDVIKRVEVILEPL